VVEESIPFFLRDVNEKAKNSAILILKIMRISSANILPTSIKIYVRISIADLY